MDRPRATSIVSGIAASVAAFLVVSRWDLAGTLIGAAIMPVIGTLVSHWSLSGMQRLGERARRLRAAGEGGLGVSDDGDRSTGRERLGAQPERREETAQPEEAGRPEVRTRLHPVRPAALQWLVLSMSCLALVASVSAVALREVGEPDVIRERVIEKTVEKTVTVTSEVEGPASDGTDTNAPGATTPDTTSTGQEGTTGDAGAGGDVRDESAPTTTLRSEGSEQGDGPGSTTTATSETLRVLDSTGQ